MTPRALGALLALVVLALDQATKAAALWAHAGHVEEPLALAPFLDFALRWNRGISFSLFAQDSPEGRAILVGLAAVAVAALSAWLWRSRSRVVAIALGAVIGGALGNAIDRLVYLAVVDFLDLHAFGRHFFVFNLADAAINVGVALLVFDALFAGHPRRGLEARQRS